MHHVPVEKYKCTIIVMYAASSAPDSVISALYRIELRTSGACGKIELYKDRKIPLLNKTPVFIDNFFNKFVQDEA